MKFLKPLTLSIVLVLLFSFTGCAKPDKSFGVEQKATDDTESIIVSSVQDKITSLDSMMSKYFDITLFDEENYSNIYLGKDFKLSAKYNGTKFTFPSKLDTLERRGWQLVDGSDYNKNSLIYAKETAELTFSNKYSNKITVLFFNSLNTSVRLSECKAVKFRIKNDYVNNHDAYTKFNINGITNTSVVTDIFEILGTPSHFYKKSENSYYFDYFYEESDRRNKIRIYVNLNYDIITEVEFSNYK